MKSDMLDIGCGFLIVGSRAVFRQALSAHFQALSLNGCELWYMNNRLYTQAVGKNGVLLDKRWKNSNKSPS